MFKKIVIQSPSIIERQESSIPEISNDKKLDKEQKDKIAKSTTSISHISQWSNKEIKLSWFSNKIFNKSKSKSITKLN